MTLSLEAPLWGRCLSLPPSATAPRHSTRMRFLGPWFIEQNAVSPRGAASNGLVQGAQCRRSPLYRKGKEFRSFPWGGGTQGGTECCGEARSEVPGLREGPGPSPSVYGMGAGKGLCKQKVRGTRKTARDGQGPSHDLYPKCLSKVTTSSPHFL